MIWRHVYLIILVLMFAFQNVPSTAADVVIGDDGGGYVSIYNMRFQQYKKTKARVVFAGACSSACARYMALPGACALPKATFWFHAMTDGERVQPQASIQDSWLNENAKAFALEAKYDVWRYGFTKSRRIPKPVHVEPGVDIIHTETPRRRVFQKWLRVKATLIVPPCG